MKKCNPEDYAMENVYLRPVVEVISFAPSKAIAMDDPGWGWEDDVFGSTAETKPEFSEGIEEGWD